MKIICTSDTHTKHRLLPPPPPADVFLFGGDLMNSGLHLKGIADFNDWLNLIPLPTDRKLICLGNHDIAFDEDHPLSNKQKAKEAKALITNGKTLIDEETIVDGIKFYGSPWTPRFFNWAFNADRGVDIKQHWDLIPEDVDVLVTHGPPFGILDQIVPEDHPSPLFPHLGCKDLSEKLSRCKKMKHHIFGHIHGSRGQTQVHGVAYTNASFLTELYKPFPRSGYFILEI